MEQAIIMEKDMLFARQLRQALSKLRQLRVAVVPALEDACVAIMRQPRDWAFVPLDDFCQTAVTLRELQPDIRLVVLLPDGDTPLPDACAEQADSAIAKDRIAQDLATMLKIAIAARPSTSPRLEKTELDTAVLIAALHEVELDQVAATAVLARADRYLAHWGALAIAQARDVVKTIGADWMETKPQSRMQFLQLPDEPSESLIYLRRILDDYFLLLVAVAEAPLYELRRRADEAATALEDAITGKITSAVEHAANANGSHAMVWRPVRPLPAVLCNSVENAIQRLADTNGCRLLYSDIQPEYVHLVAAGPPGKDSSWTATLFKNGSEETIQQEFEVNTRLWNAGFYATDSKRPLTNIELNLFLTD